MALRADEYVISIEKWIYRVSVAENNVYMNEMD
jgi:hypothetical protein